ncbi:SAM-dependent methyltransferase [Catenulispora sp. NF23]|uniref:SAM-dependent methyltransferase n=1 Tax=Catenulispora pinistramenti TaxID=2705254 RepID=A0ABS5KRH7_9ACTN|nr:SAM-dependent methyltransferase [Catenulispora pinistramenti]MBS2534834.1 SAM-dependent methyltransferase [Catenulispora pinistramenti]MBS2548624.1 SAM-dependent methyltransferase [Catenulispora pinistramenti]
MDAIDVAELALSLPDIDPSQPSPARIYDFWLGGSQNFEADREAGRRAAEAMPTLVGAIRANRAFLGRVVRRLARSEGITQFLDLGSGVPTVGNVHEVAMETNPEARVVYVDVDQVAIAHARALLTDVPNAVAILADLRRPETVLAHPLLQQTLDMSKPVAVLMNAVLHFVPDSEDPAAIVAAYIAATAPGSYLALSHAAPDLAHPGEQQQMLDDYQRSTRVPFINREPEVIAAWLTGLEIQPPGLVTVDQWEPEPNAAETPILRTYGVLARKPLSGHEDESTA